MHTADPKWIPAAQYHTQIIENYTLFFPENICFVKNASCETAYGAADQLTWNQRRERLLQRGQN